jgi:hypothetical protein
MNPYTSNATLAPKPVVAPYILNGGFKVIPTNLYNESIAAKMFNMSLEQLSAMRKSGRFPKPTILSFGKPSWKGSALIAFLKTYHPAVN